jgi:hypothetical protein
MIGPAASAEADGLSVAVSVRMSRPAPVSEPTVADLAWEEMMSSGSHQAILQLYQEASQLEFRPTMSQVHWLISAFTPEATLADDDRMLLSALIDQLFSSYPDLIDTFVDAGLVSAACSVFPACTVAHFLSRAISASERACEEAIAQGIAARLPELIASMPDRDARAFVELAGSFGEWESMELSPELVLCLLRLISSSDGDVVHRAISGLFRYVRWSELFCELVLNSDDVLPVFDILMEPGNWRIRCAIFRLFGAILYCSRVCPGPFAARILAILVSFLDSSTREEEMGAILEAMTDGCRQGGEFAMLCCSSPIVPHMMELFNEDVAFTLKISVFDVLCSLFAVADAPTKAAFEELGFFEFFVENGQNMAAECGHAIIDAIRSVMVALTQDGGESWKEFLGHEAMAKIVQLLCESDDCEVRYAAEEIQKALDADD